MRVWCQPNERITFRYTRNTVKYGGGSLSVWGCFSSKGVRNLVKIDGHMTGVSYVNILRENLKPSARTMALRNFTFQQDNNPKHIEKISKLDWPSQSPGLSPTEHLWSILDDRIPMSLRTNLERFWTAMQAEWINIPRHLLLSLASSMPKRLQNVIEAKGDHTKY